MIGLQKKEHFGRNSHQNYTGMNISFVCTSQTNVPGHVKVKPFIQFIQL